MGKKKRQVDPSVLAGGDSSDSNDESQPKSTATNCPHASKAIHLAGVKKALKNDGLPKQCVECSKGTSSKLGDNADTDEFSLLICLRCGHTGCGNGQKHAEQHSKNRQSDVHDFALNSMTWIVWCFKCNIEIPSNSSKKLLECVEYVKKNAVSRNSNIEKALSNEKIDETKPIGVDLLSRKTPISISYTISNSLNSCEARSNPSLDSLPKVRGLVNLGNTCFFNAVLQCLAQTPFLVPLLEEIKEGGQTYRLPGGEIEIAKEKVHLEPLEGVLKEWGNLTRTLVETLTELQSGKPEVFSPQRLLRLLHTKCPQFAGFDQHDSHELLRQLLEMVRTEDLQRYQRSIVEKFNLEDKNARKNISDEMRMRTAAYGRQANNLMLRPEQVFRGFLVSTLECQECHNTSEHVESFLDLSLPVMADKPVHIRRKSNSEEGGDLSPSQPSKHQLKKKWKQNSRNRRSKHRISQPSSAAGDAVIAEENAKNSSDSDNQDQSDADVEDNAEVEPESNQAQDVIESGYSSEKPVNGDSTCGSPASETNVHINRDSAIASPVTNDNLIMNKPTDEVLDLNIPDNSLSKDNQSSPGSHVSMACQPSPMTSSSEMNLECPEMEVGMNLERPTSRFEYNSESLESNSELRPSYIENALEGTSSDVKTEKTKSFGIGELNGDIDITPLLDGENDKMARLDNQFCKLDLEVPKREKAASILDFYDENDEEDDTGLSKGRDTWNTSYGQRNLAESSGECTLHSCLNQFTAKELMTGNNKVGCDACTKKINQGKEGKTILTNASKQLLISSPPAILILHLKRFQVVSFTFKKKSREVKFPMVFDLTPYCSVKCKKSPTVRNDQNELLYSLYGVVEHIGTLHGGHYVAYVKVREPVKPGDPRWSFLPNGCSSEVAEKLNATQNGAVGGTVEPPPGRWYYVSDSMVSEVKEENVLRSQAYLLFYERFW
ncbi:UNVERIFIED_CONTAM: hypothetical protein PYX00_002897 [Menopon gallinae]|uniref:Ubiquitin carboxyl-terminal hydrolase n=1 Tax=Menopon gallinae TaxID=328185 RepID=A0AAW2HXS3_9NEOP